ncbi:MAG: 3-hydroxyacyl-CoA dehydrogenase NAD-binding domain-containing protein [Gemmataceae bacterium]|nr:3-hydroxyacyl-CoA dehydrogenase NAD-binding domain-containing protein [Gemmataceae bacterium]
MAFFQSDTLWVSQLPDNVAGLVLDVPGRGINTLSRAVLTDLDTALDRIAADGSFRLLVIRSAKPGSFIAGADVHELAQLKGPEDAARFSELGQRVLGKLAALPIPTASIITGACLGGGLELAMACDYRVVIDHPRTQLGLPEIELGLLPAWGGTQRLPRLVGLERALRIIVGGRRLDATEAVKWGLADGLADEEDEGPPDCLSAPVKRPLGKLPRHTWRQTLLESNALGRWLIFRGTERLIRRRAPDDMPAPWEALEAVRVGIKKGMDAGLSYEREAAARLAESDACRNLIRLFLQREEARRPWQGKNKEGIEPIRKVGVVGAGLMGGGIAQLAAIKGCDVVIREANRDALAIASLRLALLLEGAVIAGALAAEDLARRRDAIHGTTEWRGFADLDLALEAVVEDERVKRTLFREMEKHTSRSTILATNTSSLRVESLAEDLQYPERVAGLHFFNPVHKMPLVEIARTSATKQEVLDSLAVWAVRLGKVPVFVKDSPGFVVNRVLAPYLHEAVLLIAEGMRTSLVDQSMIRFGMPVGPLELLDRVGLDTAAEIAKSLQPLFEGRLEPNPALERLRDAGWLGQKTSLGFYRYRKERTREHNLAMAVVRESIPGREMEPASPDDLMAQARERMVLLMVNEAARCLGEGVAESADQIDLAMVLGSGWAPHRGGPLRYAEQRGYGEVIEALTELAERLGPRFEPCAELQRLAGQDQ